MKTFHEKTRQAFPNLARLQLEKNRRGWMKSFLEGFSQDENGNAVPWMTYPAIEFLQENLREEHEVFEFGAGASTIFFSQRVRKVVTLETNKKWYEIISTMLADLDIKNVELILMSDGLKNSAYENFAKNRAEKFDFIIIDSLKRFECATISTTALKPGGIMLLDDSERKNYAKIFKFFAEKNFKQTDFLGVSPAQLRIKNTTIFRS
jgi:predicted O-methyltransferase YrrM